jgi:hypothetical protein
MKIKIQKAENKSLAYTETFLYNSFQDKQEQNADQIFLII